MAQIIKADLDQMVFEDRERGYGAFFLRKKYPLHLMIGTILIGFIALTGTFVPLLAKQLGWVKEKEKVKFVQVKISMDELPPPPPMDEEKPPPPPPPKVPPPQVKTVAFQIPEPVPEEEIDPDEPQTIATVEELQDAPNLGFENKEGDDAGVVFTGEVDGDGDVPQVIVDNEPKIDEFISVEQEPAPVNMDDIQKLIGYPQIARDAGIQGQVVVRVLVDKKGRYSKHRIVKEIHPILAEAVEKHISKLNFTPAIQGGRPIKFWVNIPFNFKLLN